MSLAALVTGGASGIGLAVARSWVAGGGRVGILDVDGDAVAAAVAVLGAEHTIGEVADVREADRVHEVVSFVAEQLGGRLDVVVNSAGIAQPIVAADGSDEDWGRLVDIHLNGTMRASRSAHEYLLRSDRAAIVNISSIAGATGRPGRSHYSASKAAIEGLTRALAVEWSPHIRVNAVAPGYVHTPMIDTLIESGRLDPSDLVARTPLARLCQPDEIAAAVMFLAGREASFVTGQTLLVDGGITVEGNWYARAEPRPARP